MCWGAQVNESQDFLSLGLQSVLRPIKGVGDQAVKIQIILFSILISKASIRCDLSGTSGPSVPLINHIITWLIKLLS